MVENLLEIISERRNQKFSKPKIDVKSVTNGIDETGLSMSFLLLPFFAGR